MSYLIDKQIGEHSRRLSAQQSRDEALERAELKLRKNAAAIREEHDELAMDRPEAMDVLWSLYNGTLTEAQVQGWRDLFDAHIEAQAAELADDEAFEREREWLAAQRGVAV